LMDSSTLLPAAGPALEPIVAGNVLLGLAFALLIAIVGLAWLSGAQRMTTWYLLLLSSSAYCLSFMVLVGHQRGPEPPLPYCALSAVFIYAAPPIVAGGVLLFVIELHLRLISILASKTMGDKFTRWAPWCIVITHAVPFWVSLIIGLSDVSKIKRDPSGVYCHIEGSLVPTALTGSLVVLYMVLMFVVEGVTLVHLLRRRSSVRAVKLRGSDFPLHLFGRTLFFTVSGGFAVIIVLVMNFVKDVSSELTVGLVVSMPLAAVLVFGTQRELLRTIFACRFRRYKVDCDVKSGEA